MLIDARHVTNGNLIIHIARNELFKVKNLKLNAIETKCLNEVAKAL